MTAPEDGKKPETAVPQTQGLRATRKAVAAAKKAAKKATPNNVHPIKRTPAKKAAPEKAAKKAAPEKATGKVRDKDHPWYTRKSYTPVPGQKLYEATGASGQIAVRSCGTVVTHAISWAHSDWPGERAKAIREGVISHFYPDEETAKRAAEKIKADNPSDSIAVVPACEYRGQSGDKK